MLKKLLLYCITTSSLSLACQQKEKPLSPKKQLKINPCAYLLKKTLYPLQTCKTIENLRRTRLIEHDEMLERKHIQEKMHQERLLMQR